MAASEFTESEIPVIRTEPFVISTQKRLLLIVCGLIFIALIVIGNVVTLKSSAAYSKSGLIKGYIINYAASIGCACFGELMRSLLAIL